MALTATSGKRNAIKKVDVFGFVVLVFGVIGVGFKAARTGDVLWQPSIINSLILSDSKHRSDGVVVIIVVVVVVVGHLMVVVVVVVIVVVVVVVVTVVVFIEATLLDIPQRILAL